MSAKAPTPVTCPHCQNSTVIRSIASKSYVCNSCGSQIELNTGSVMEQKDSRRSKSHTDLYIGLKGKMDGVEIEIVGWLLYFMQEDYERYYWEEWVAVGPDATYWITYDRSEKVYKFFKQQTIALPKHPNSYRQGSRINLDGTRYRVREKSVGKLVGILGEIPWKAKTGEYVHYIDAGYRNKRLSIEWTDNELEVFTGKEITRKQILQSFPDLKPQLEKYLHNERTRLHWDKLKDWVIGSMLLGVTFALFMGLMSKKLVYKETFTLCAERTTITGAPIPTNIHPPSNCVPTSMPLGPFTLGTENRVAEISIESHTTTQSNWPYVLVELQDDQQQPLRGFAGDFWRQAWKEGGESGVDSKTKESQLFRVDKTGEYYLYAELDKDPIYNTNDSDTFTVKVHTNVSLIRYFLSFSGIVSLVPFIKNKWYEVFLEG